MVEVELVAVSLKEVVAEMFASQKHRQPTSVAGAVVATAIIVVVAVTVVEASVEDLAVVVVAVVVDGGQQLRP
jgi:hypothetical protein